MFKHTGSHPWEIWQTYNNIHQNILNCAPGESQYIGSYAHTQNTNTHGFAPLDKAQLWAHTFKNTRFRAPGESQSRAHLGSPADLSGRKATCFNVWSPSWAPPGAFSGFSWALLGASSAVSGPGLSWGRLGSLLGRLEALLGASWAVLGRRKA